LYKGTAGQTAAQNQEAANPSQINPNPILGADLPCGSESEFFRIIPFFLVEKRHI
jgi:hypothetical protein